MLQPITRPKGAEAAMVHAPAVHTQHSRHMRAHDFWYNPDHFFEIVEAGDGTIDEVLEHNVEAPGAGDNPSMLETCLAYKGFFVKGVGGKPSTLLDDVSKVKGGMKTTNAFFSKKLCDRMFGHLRQGQMEAAATTDAYPQRTQVRPAIQRPILLSENVSEFRFNLEHVYRMVRDASDETIDEITFNVDKDGQEMQLRDELVSGKKVEVSVSDRKDETKEIALGVRYSEKFSRNRQRLDVIDTWVDHVIIRGRNALRNEGVRKARTGLSAEDISSMSSEKQKQLRKMDLLFQDHYMPMDPMGRISTLVMNESVFLDFDEPVTQNSAPNENTLVGLGGYSLLNGISMNTGVGIVGNLVIDATAANDNKYVLQLVGDYCMDLYVYMNMFMVRTWFEEDSRSYVTDVCIEYVPVFADKNARHLWAVK